MRFSRQFINVTIADFIVRSAYQMGKTPLLPVFAQTLGAGEVFLGLIVSVSTRTGIILKPIVGVLADIWGRRAWLMLGTLFFTIMPFVYRWVSTPEELFTVRIIHGVATAIYGPVTLAFVAEMHSHSRAERLAWFGSARNGGYIVGPALGGWLLLILDPVSVFTIIGFLSVLAFIPLIGIADMKKMEFEHNLFFSHIISSFMAGSRNISVWIAGILEAFIYMILYAIKAFLPIYASSSVGFNIAVIGMFFSIQEAVRLIFNPLGGRMAESGKWFKPSDGESHRDVERRFSNWLEDELLFNDDFVGKPGHRRVAIVSHGLALQCLFHYIMGFNHDLIGRFPINNTSISRFRFNQSGWYPVSINDASHTEALGDILREGTRRNPS